MDIEAALHRQLPELPPDAAAGSRTGTPCRVIDSDTAAAVVLSPALKRAMKEAGAVGPRRSPRLHQSPRTPERRGSAHSTSSMSSTSSAVDAPVAAAPTATTPAAPSQHTPGLMASAGSSLRHRISTRMKNSPILARMNSRAAAPAAGASTPSGTMRRVDVSRFARPPAFSVVSGNHSPALRRQSISVASMTSRRELTESRWHTLVPQAQLSEMTKVEVHRQEAIHELITSEESYVDDMNVVVNVFVRPLRMLNLMKPHELATIFGIIEDLLACNKSFLDNLHARQKQAEDKVVGSVADIISDFVGARPAHASSMVNVYSTYCGNQRHGKELLKQKMRNPVIAEAISRLSSVPELRRLDITDFLDQPRRRLSKYTTVIAEIAKTTPTTHPDYAAMQDAKANFADACQAIDEAAGFIDNRHRLAEIQVAMLSSSRLDPSRAILIKAAQEVLYEGDLRLVSGPRTAVPCKVVVMNNVVLFLRTKEKDGMVAYRLLRDSAALLQPVPVNVLQARDDIAVPATELPADVRHTVHIGMLGARLETFAIIACDGMKQKAGLVRKLHEVAPVVAAN